MFGSSVGFSQSANLMVQLSMTLSDPEPQFLVSAILTQKGQSRWSGSVTGLATSATSWQLDSNRTRTVGNLGSQLVTY